MRCEYNRDHPDHYEHELLVSDLHFLASLPSASSPPQPPAQVSCRTGDPTANREQENEPARAGGSAAPGNLPVDKQAEASSDFYTPAREGSVLHDFNGALRRCHVHNTPGGTVCVRKIIFLVEGILILECEALRNLVDLRVFVECDPALVQQRRLARDRSRFAWYCVCVQVLWGRSAWAR